MSTPYDEAPLDEPGYTICPDCGDDLEWHLCGYTPPKSDLEPVIRRVVEAHDGLCLDGKEEREELIRALTAALTSTANHHDADTSIPYPILSKSRRAGGHRRGIRLPP